ncbi:MAG: hypothetical protein ACTHNI_05505 [Cellulosimicrobium cellulans]
MSNGIVRHTAGGVDRPSQAGRTTRSTEAGAASTQGTAFEGTVLGWDDMPRESREAALWRTDVVAEHVDRVSSTATVLGGVPHQRMVAWRAHVDRVVVATAVRPLRARPDGRLSPSGDWRHHDVAHHVAQGVPRRREGVVPAGAPTSGGTATAHPAPRPPRDQAKGQEASSYLPAAVRQGMVDAVPVPHTWRGEIVRFSEDGYPVRHRITVLRADDAHAVVVVAERGLPPTGGYPDPATADAVLSARPWSVTQMTYALRPASAALPSSTARGRSIEGHP